MTHQPDSLNDQELDKILSYLGTSNIPDTNGIHEVDPTSIKYVKEKLIEWRDAQKEQWQINGRRIQAEVTLEKWQAMPDEGDFTMFLYGQLDSHNYELAELLKSNSGGESDE